MKIPREHCTPIVSISISKPKCQNITPASLFSYITDSSISVQQTQLLTLPHLLLLQPLLLHKVSQSCGTFNPLSSSSHQHYAPFTLGLTLTFKFNLLSTRTSHFCYSFFTHVFLSSNYQLLKNNIKHSHVVKKLASQPYGSWFSTTE